MSVTAQASAPDLSHLPYETRVRLMVAAKQGFYWENKGDERFPHWCLRNPSKPVFPAAVISQGGRCEVAPERLPDYLHDPAAYGALQRKERIAVVPSEDGWYALAPSDVEHGHVRGTPVPTLTIHGPEFGGLEPQDDIGWAISLAFLAKHGVTVPITPERS